MSDLQEVVKINHAQMVQAIAALKETMGNHAEEAFKAAVEYAKEGSPVGTPQSTGIPGYVGGTNRKSITLDVDRKNMGLRIYTQSGYGGWLEVGTKKMGARPYIMPGFTRSVEELSRSLEGIA